MYEKYLVAPYRMPSHMTDTSIRIEGDVRDRLRAEKKGGETYSDVIDRLLDE